MTSLNPIANRSAWTEQSTGTRQAGTTGTSSEFQAAMDKSESRAKSITGTPDTNTDETARVLARLDTNYNNRLSQSQFDTGSASTIQAAGRLPTPSAAFARGGVDDTRASETGSTVALASQTRGTNSAADGNDSLQQDYPGSSAFGSFYTTGVALASTRPGQTDTYTETGTGTTRNTVDALDASQSRRPDLQQGLRQYQLQSQYQTTAAPSDSSDSSGDSSVSAVA